MVIFDHYSRLVVIPGYLKAEGCNKTYQAFLTESAHLQEYTTFLHRGIEYPTKIGGRGLIDMLEDYGRIKLHGKHMNFSHLVPFKCYVTLFLEITCLHSLVMLITLGHTPP